MILLVYALIVSPALAQIPLPDRSLFSTPNPLTPGSQLKDVAFILLDSIFGVPGIFCSEGGTCTAVQGTLPQPFHIALHDLLKFYSIGLLFIGLLIFLYFVVVVVFETATTGTPFGQRFENGWVPIRLIVAIGLLLPINYGLNSGQYIVLYAAKFGSGLATNGWHIYNEALAQVNVSNPLGEHRNLLAIPSAPDLTPVAQSMAIAHACAYGYWHMDNNPVNDWFNYPMPPHEDFYINAYFVKKLEPWMQDRREYMLVTPDTTYEDALAFFENANIAFVFGQRDVTRYSQFAGGVKPLCGIVTVTISDLRYLNQGATVGGADAMQEYYFNLVRDMWHDRSGGYGGPDFDLINTSQRFMAVVLRQKWTTTATNPGRPLECVIGCDIERLPSCRTAYIDPCQSASGPVNPGVAIIPDCLTEEPCVNARQFFINFYNGELESELLRAWDKFNDVIDDFDMTTEILDLNWGGAGAWFNSIARVNGAFITATTDIPKTIAMPWIMDEIKKTRMANATDTTTTEIYSPHLPAGQTVQDATDMDLAVAGGLNKYFKWWNDSGANQADSSKVASGSVFRDTMNMMFGTNALFSMLGKNAHIHPLAQLAALGKGLVDSAVRNVGLSIFTAALGGPAGVIDPRAGSAVSAISGFLVSTAFVGLTAGFILFYIVPFLPFLYTFFAVAEWCKSLFEAMVGIPLCALAHLRIDGAGLPGDAAANGYFLVFEIFIRPILIIFGLIAALVVFTAQVRLLNMIWLLVIDNLTGFSTTSDVTVSLIYDIEVKRDIIDQFFFTVIYAIVVHMIAMACFKLIDSIPGQILRWAGSGASSFADITKEDPVGGLQNYAVFGGITVGRQVTSSLQSAASGSGQVLGGLLSGLKGKGK